MTTRLPRESSRVTSRLADSADYVFATVVLAGRWLCTPLRRTTRAAALEPAYAFVPTGIDAAALQSGRAGGKPQTSAIVRTAEIVMLSAAFFLAAHLLAGGTPTAVAPNLNPLGLLPSQARAESLPVATVQRQVTVDAGQFGSLAPATQAPAQVEEAAATPEAAAPTQEAALLAPAPGAAGGSASLPAEESAPAAVATPAPPVQPPPPPVPPAPPEATAPSTSVAPVGRIYTEAEVRAAALTAGWAPELLDQVVKVAWCESRFNSGAEYLGARGLMQIIVGYWFEPFGLDPNLWADPVVNLRAARFAYEQNKEWSGDGWAAWTCKP